MDRNRFEHICLEVEAGRDAFTSHPDTDEQGIVTSCIKPTNHLIVETAGGEKRSWDYHECEDLHRPKSGPMVT